MMLPLSDEEALMLERFIRALENWCSNPDHRLDERHRLEILRKLEAPRKAAREAKDH